METGGGNPRRGGKGARATVRRQGRALSRSRRGRTLPRAVWLPFVAAVLAYLPTLSHSFVWDDVNFIRDNPAAHRVGDLATALRHGYGWVPTGSAGPDASLYFRPVVTVSNTLTWALGRGGPLLFHLHNLLTHAAAAALLALLGLWLGLSPGGALLAGGLFAVHPVLSEAVAWISGRTDLFAGVFTLATLVLLLGWRQGRLPGWMGRRRPWVAGLTLFLALASKESGAALLLLAPLVCLWPLAAAANPGTPSARGTPWIPLGLAFLLYLLLRGAVLGADALGGHDPLPDRGSLPVRLLLGGGLVLVYLYRILVPWPLSVEPPSLLAGARAPAVLGIAGLLVLLAAAALWLRFWSRRPQGAPPTSPAGGDKPERAGSTVSTGLLQVLGLGLFLLGLLPVLQWVPTGEIYGERFLYLPLAGLFLLAAGHLDPWLRGRPARAWTLLGIVLVPCLVLLESRLPDWRDETRLFSSAVRVHPKSARALANLGSALMAQGKAEDAGRYLEEAVRLDPADPWKHGQYGALLVNTGRFQEGAQELELAWRSGARSKTLLKNLGIAWTRVARFDEAAEVLAQAMALDPSDPSLPDALGLVERKRSHYPQAAALFQRSIQMDPTRKGVWLNLISMLLNESRDMEQARVWAARFLQAYPAAPEAASLRTLLSAKEAGTAPTGTR